ncbi:protein SERAC1 [Marchantia polymorpha subsp. ruderalis]|uniref:NB-ARC domain-containing protein n=2 Tax=Marchantia polymorpha TaxID=3197 RepID=A0AAF6AVT1_MARPO|nr:hypothetical protein MARPO_0007s0015 [Marchantia polymorpha]BBN03865.1 hypothetical protein Mp_3g00170 [Marchantia polymorpha subsp. ruderalis]|eukprot:PTQ47555.1 hypothetical protein MARPO_0007s0015 [Marchantia polymorpha]
MSLPPAYSATAAPQLSDSVYELYKPGVESLLDVVFFHGLQLSHTYVAHLSTWRSRGSQKEVWPMTWLPEEFPGARILSVKYDACIITSAEHGRLDLYCTAESLMQDLISAKVGQHPWRPVILVGHSYGGLVIKQLCLHAHLSQSLHLSKEQMAGFLNCVKGIFFYGTPHHGMSSFLSPNGAHLKDASPLVDYVKLLCAESARLHQNFDALRLSYKWSIAGVGESRPTTFLIIEAGSKNVVAVSSEMVVDEASARYGDFTVELEDHVSLCQPESRTSNTYLRLTAFIQSIDFNKVKRRRLLDNFQTVPKMAMSLHSHLFVEVQNILRTAPAVGLCGMGGIGKTTLAKLLFNELCAEFEYTCFVPGFMLKGDYQELERGVYSLMHHHGTQIAGTGKNKKWKSTALRMKTLLLVLEDIDNDNHIELLQNISSVNDCANSRYIVTSRDRDILNSSGARVFDVKLLNQKSSKELFMSYAFPYPTQPSPSLTEWVDKIVVKCDGLPLTLEVMGKYLQRKVSESIWKQCLDALDEADNVIRLDERLWAKLRVSYDRLGSQEKEIFLDAASFFNNSRWSLREAKSSWRVLYGLEDLRWQTLVDMSLVYDVDEKDRIQMHEQLRSLGIRLASGWGTCGRCRTWTKKNVPSRFNSSNFDESISERQIYSSESGPCTSSTGMETHIEEVLALRLEDSMSLNSRNICQMKKLQYLDSEKEMVLDAEGGKLPKNLVLLRWRGEVDSFHDLVDRGLAGRLAVLDLKVPLTCLPTTVSDFRNLEVLKFQGCLFQCLPETFVRLPRLRHLIFSNCGRLSSLPEAFGRLSQLQSFELHCCCNLEVLPDSFVQLPRLQTLIIDDVDKLQRLPEGFGNLSQLQSLLISYGQSMSELPECFGRLARLRDLLLDHMFSLQALPDSFGQLPQLSHLTMVACRIIRDLPESFGHLANLTVLHIRDCRSLEALPNSFGALRSLQYLRVSDCFALTDLPSSFGQLTSLQDLIIEVPHFTSVPDSIRQLPSLQRMVLTLPYLETPCSWLPSMDNLDKYNIYRVLFGQPSSSALVHFKTVFSVENGVFHFKECDTSVHVYTTLQSVNLQYGPSGIFSDQPVQ